MDCGFDGIIVYVDEGNKESKWYSVGYKNRENKTPANPNAVFKIASVD